MTRTISTRKTEKELQPDEVNTTLTGERTKKRIQAKRERINRREDEINDIEHTARKFTGEMTK